MLLKYNFKLQPNFWANEFFSSKDPIMPTYEQMANVAVLAQFMQKLRDALKKEIRITSGARSKVYNDSPDVKGSKNSYHLKGLACDFELIERVNGKAVEDYGPWTVETLLSVFELCGFSNVGFYMRNGKFQWIHADIGTPWKEGTNNTWKKYSDKLSYQVLEV